MIGKNDVQLACNITGVTVDAIWIILLYTPRVEQVMNQPVRDIRTS